MIVLKCDLVSKIVCNQTNNIHLKKRIMSVKIEDLFKYNQEWVNKKLNLDPDFFDKLSE